MSVGIIFIKKALGLASFLHVETCSHFNFGVFHVALFFSCSFSSSLQPK